MKKTKMSTIDSFLKEKGIEAARGKHSEKPEEVRKRIEEPFGDLPRIELFARHRSEGWGVWGDEITEERMNKKKKIERF